MNWHMAAKELPEFDEDVLVAFENGACVVACRCFDDDANKEIWWTLDHNYFIDPTDMWCVIILPTAEELVS